MSRVRGYENRCSICGREMKIRASDARDIPIAVRLQPPRICSDCVEDLYDKKEDIFDDFMDEYDEEYQRKIQASLNSGPQPQTEKSKEGETTQADPPKIKSYKELSSMLKQVVIGQDDQVEQLCLAIIKKERSTSEKTRSNIIIVGDSGSGKSLMVRELAKILGKPVTLEDSTNYTEEGYVGDSVRDMLTHLINVAGGNVERAQRGIVIVDEGDKKGGLQDHNRDVSGQKVLESMLVMLDGEKVTIPRRGGMGDIVFDTSNLTFIFVGAFPGLEKIREKRLRNSTSIGFGLSEQKPEEKITSYIPEDFIKFGISAEFINRFTSAIIEMKTLTVEDFVHILKYAKYSPLKQEEKDLQREGITFVYSDDVIQEIAEKAYSYKSGARALSLVVNFCFEKMWKEILENEPGTFATCMLLKGVTQDKSKYVID